MLQNILLEAPFWLGWIITVLLLLFAIFLAWKSWFGDPSNGRRRCPRCWYDMAYTEGMTCSECGHVAQHEGEFSRTRRRWLRGILCVLLATVVILFAREQTLQNGWAALLPSRALVWSLPMFGDSNNQAVDQLLRRMNQGMLSEENLDRLVQRCAKGDGGSHPGTQPWANKYGAILNRFRPALAARRQGSALYDLERHLLDIPPFITLQAREHWPMGASARVGVQALNWWPFGSDTRLRITPRMEGAESETVLFRGLNTPNTSFSVLTPPLDADVREIVIEVATMRRTSELSDEWVPVSVRQLSVPVRVEGDIASMMSPVSGPALDEALKSAFNGVTKWINGPRRLRFYVSPGRTGIAEFNGVAIGFVSELIHDGEVVLVDHTWWMGGPNLTDRGFGSWSEDPKLDSLLDMDLAEGEWLIHVISDPQLAIRAGEADKYWAGEFTIPMTLRQIPRTAPEPHWWLEDDELSEIDGEEN